MKAPKLTYDKQGFPVVPKGFKKLGRYQTLLEGDLWAFGRIWKKTNFVGELTDSGLYIRRIGGLK